MITRNKLPELLHTTLMLLGGAATIVEVCECFWKQYNKELEKSEDLFYTWQYDIRWAATELRKVGTMLPADSSAKGIWKLR